MFCSLMIKSRSFSEPGLFGCEHTSASQHHHPLVRKNAIEWAGVGDFYSPRLVRLW